MPEPLSAPSPFKPRRTARDRVVRRQRIMERMREGRSYEEIAEAEGLSRERIRQIVVEALGRRKSEQEQDHAQLQIVRLAPALRLAAKGIGEGDRRAIADLVRVLDRLDKYQATSRTVDGYYEGGREKLLTKLNSMVERMKANRTGEEAREAAEQGAAAPDEEMEAENPADAFPWGLKP